MRVVQDPATQRLGRTGRVELDGAVEDVGEGRERLRALDEGMHLGGLVAVDPRGHVDDHEPADQPGVTGSDGSGGQPAERHPDEHLGLGRQRADHHRQVVGVLARAVAPVDAPVRPAVTGQVDGQHRHRPRGERHRVPRVGVLCPTVDQHQPRRSVAPPQRRQRAPVGQGVIHPAAPPGRRAAPGRTRRSSPRSTTSRRRRSRRRRGCLRAQGSTSAHLRMSTHQISWPDADGRGDVRRDPPAPRPLRGSS